jgi:hypothetical protein
MSTSPDTQKGNNIRNNVPNALRSAKRGGNPGLILLRGILWLALLIGVLVALAMNYEIVWDVLDGTVIPGLEKLFEVAEAALDSFFLLVGVSASMAPWATAYTGFVMVAGVLYLTARKAIRAYQKIQTKKQEVSQTYASAWEEWYGTVKATTTKKFTIWWNSLDVYNKVFAVIFLALIGIPVMLLLSLILGNIVASLI